jgi:hypothetical protein
MKFSRVENDVIWFEGGRADDLYLTVLHGAFYYKNVIVHSDLTIQSQVMSSITLMDIEIAINLVTLYQQHVKEQEEADTLTNYLVHKF